MKITLELKFKHKYCGLTLLSFSVSTCFHKSSPILQQTNFSTSTSNTTAHHLNVIAPRVHLSLDIQLLKYYAPLREYSPLFSYKSRTEERFLFPRVTFARLAEEEKYLISLSQWKWSPAVTREGVICRRIGDCSRE